MNKNYLGNKAILIYCKCSYLRRKSSTLQSSPYTGEILLINKPYRWTSFDAVNKIKSILRHERGIKTKVGHAGTLDPLATGLLVVCTGPFTKKISEFQDAEKEYAGTFFTGATTPSFDLETEVDATYSTEQITKQLAIETSKQFTGEIQQVPPLYSAIKLQGQRAYEKARKGQAATLEARKVTIREFEITGFNLPEIQFRVVCSKGTYIRSLARDFGKAMRSGAYLSSLIRTRIGEFQLKDALTPDELLQKMAQEKS